MNVNALLITIGKLIFNMRTSIYYIYINIK